jgi:hypothetical protein
MHHRTILTLQVRLCSSMSQVFVPPRSYSPRDRSCLITQPAPNRVCVYPRQENDLRFNRVARFRSVPMMISYLENSQMKKWVTEEQIIRILR